ncbi:type IV secretion system DNA-binding domain-containing protein [Candidatus Roizmanbacteria bacterium]|nr:type IV secretion system DNA-binding domain-containing protein [Candidatus Roizmanbacteria bacterium]
MDVLASTEILERLITFVLALFAAAAAGALTLVLIYLVVIYFRLKKREEQSLEMVTVEVRLSKDNEIKIDAAEQMIASFASLKKSGWTSFLDVDDTIAFEIVGKKADIRFYVSAPAKIIDLVEKTVYGYYPQAEIHRADEPNIFSEDGKVAYAALVQKDYAFMPFKTYKDLPTDPLAAITSALSKLGEGEGTILQVLIRPAASKWKKRGKSYVSHTKKSESDPEKATFKTDPKTLEKIEDKASKSSFDTAVRVVVSSKSPQTANVHLRNIITSMAQFNGDLNNLKKSRIVFKGGFMLNFVYKFFPVLETPFFKSTSVFSADEVASIFHFPNKTVETPHIQWLKSKTAPVSSEVLAEGGVYIGDGFYRGVRRPIHIGLEDRRRHIYIIGKTGVGKSILLLNMAIQDIEAGRGVCVIDPHGDLIDEIVKYIPPQRAEDVIYFDPSDTGRPMGLNLLEAYTEEQQHYITTAIINLMYKLYDPQRTGIIGPRFEHAVRNAMLTAMSEQGTTFVEVVRILTDSKYVQEILPRVQDPIVRRYWTDQIAQTADFHKSEVLDYIVSKFGRFVTNKTMRNIIGQSVSAFDFRRVMDEGKVLLINLSKGKLGEENSSFLGLVLVPKILIAAMSRQEVPEEKRPDFFLYVDEFQNFATPDFATILSEARKYRLNLTVANQFIGQVEEEVKNAVFGNIGTLVSFRVGVTDASYLQREFQPVFTESDLINVERFHVYMKTIVRNEPVPPFSADLTIDMKKLKARANEKIAQAVIQLSRLKFGRPKELIEAESKVIGEGWGEEVGVPYVIPAKAGIQNIWIPNHPAPEQVRCGVVPYRSSIWYWDKLGMTPNPTS